MTPEEIKAVKEIEFRIAHDGFYDQDAYEALCEVVGILRREVARPLVAEHSQITSETRCVKCGKPLAYCVMFHCNVNGNGQSYHKECAGETVTFDREKVREKLNEMVGRLTRGSPPVAVPDETPPHDTIAIADQLLEVFTSYESEGGWTPASDPEVYKKAIVRIVGKLLAERDARLAEQTRRADERESAWEDGDVKEKK